MSSRWLCLFRAILMVVAPAVAVLGLQAPARPQSLDIERYPHLFAPRVQPPRVISIPQRTAPTQTRARPAEAVRPPREPHHPPAVAGAETPRAEPTTFVLVLGDNLAEWLSYGLKEAFEDIPELGVTDRSRLSSGLARPDFHDWVKAIPEILAQATKVDFIVMMVGSNDRQALRVDRDSIDPDSDRWRELYGQRVDEAMRAMRARGVPVYWVGLPPLRGQRSSAHAARVNEIVKERAQKNGVTFIDVWNGFVDEHGNYTQFGPDFAGQVRRLRTGDGVHFTPAGARKLALFVEPDLRRDLLGRITPAAPEAPAGEPAAALPTAPFTLPDAPLPLPPRPLAGPVLPLFGQPVIPGAPAETPAAPARLAGETAGRAPSGAAAAVLVRGDPPPPVAGRADDFRLNRDRPATGLGEAAPAPAVSTGMAP